MKTSLSHIYDLFLSHRIVTTDSRQADKGGLFFALRGEKFDGNKYALEALEKGCACAIVDDPSIAKDERFLLVEDVLEALQAMAGLHRQRLSHIPLLAITGTNGKTTTKELITRVLDKRFTVCSTQGNLNNHIGVPLTLLRLDENTGFAVIEMGANHKGEIELLCQLARPSFGIITNIGKAHLDGFGGYQGVVQAKQELFQYVKSTKGHLFVNGDDTLLMSLSQESNRTTFGKSSGTNCRASLSEEYPFLVIEWEANGNSNTIETQLYGSYNFYNALAAICIGDHFSVDAQDITSAVQQYRPDNNRSQLLTKGSNIIYLDAYNANPTSMENALRHFQRTSASDKMLILGDMFELGKYSKEEHSRLLRLVKELGFDEVILVGPEFIAAAGSAFPNVFTSWKEAYVWLERNPVSDKAILIKGSRGMELEKLADAL